MRDCGSFTQGRAAGLALFRAAFVLLSGSDERGPKLAGGGFRVWRIPDRAHDCDPPRACADDVLDVCPVDAADGEPRLARVRGRVAHELEPDRRPPPPRRRRVGWAN